MDRIAEEADQVAITAAWQINAPRESVYAIASDFEALPTHFPKLAHSASIRSRTGNHLKIDAEAASFGRLFPRVKVSIDAELIPGHGYRASTFNRTFNTTGKEQLLLHDSDSGTEIEYTYSLLGWLRLDPAVMVRVGVVKGSLFLLCTATLLYFLINRFVQQLASAENRQIESLKNYQVIFNATNEAIFILDAQGEAILDVNDSMLEIYGYKRDEALAVDIRHLSAGKPPYSKVESVEKIRRTIFEGPQIFEWLSRRKTGELFWSEVSLKKVTIDNNNRLIAVVREISERKQAEEAATNSNNLIQTVINTAPMSIFFKDKELRYMGCNNAFAKDAGVDRPVDLIGKDDFHLAWKEQAELYRTDDRNIIESGVSKISYDEPQTTPEGKQIWIRTSKVPLRNKSNEIIGVLGMYEDITDRKNAETINKRLLLRQRAILDNLPMMAWLKDTDSHLEMINEPYAKACGHTVEECIGKTDLDLFPEEMAKAYLADDREVCNSGQKKQAEESISTPDGIKWHLTYKTPIYDEQGVIIGTTGIAQDITERKRMEEALRESEKRWRLAISASPIPIMIHDEDDRVLQVSAGWTRYSGYTIEDT